MVVKGSNGCRDFLRLLVGELGTPKLAYIFAYALSQSHVNGATMQRLYSYIGIGKYLGVCQNFSARGVWGAQGPLV